MKNVQFTELLRLAALRRYVVLDTAPEPAFDDLARLAAGVCGTPMALIVFVDESRLWFKSRVGLEVPETPREGSFCEQAIGQSGLCVVQDAEADRRFAKNVLVQNPPRARFYAGAPLVTEDGYAPGTLCVLDTQPRELKPEQADALRILARQVVTQLELRRRLIELARNIEEHSETEERLRTSEAFYQTLVETLPQNIIRKDREGRFTFANRKFCQEIGRPLHEIIGRTDFDLFPEELARKYHEDDRRVMDSQQSFETTEEHQPPGGEKIYVHVIKTPLYDSTGKVIGVQGIFWDETHRRRTEEALRQAEAKYRTIYENSIEGIFQTTKDGHFISANPALARLYGYDSPEQLVAALTDIEHQLYVDPNRRDEFARLMREQGSVAGFESEVFRKDKSKFWISESARTVKDPGGNILYYEGIVEDATARKQADADREKAREAALETARTKAQFLANMSHEIRTPMNAITGMTGLLTDTKLSQEQREYVETIRGSTEALLNIINNILDFSKLEAGKVALEQIDFDLRETVESTAEMLAERAHKKGIELICHLAPGMPTRLRGDPVRVRQVLANLISNAVKFTEKGQVLVSVTALDETPAGARIRCEVSDTGIGIPPEAMRRIFQEFTQADGSTTRKYGGTGLGLTISKQLVEMMDGRMGLTSEAGRGSTFWFEIPFAKQSPSQGERPAVSLPRVRTLVVDDNGSQRALLREQLQHWQLPVETASDATQAMELLNLAAREGNPFALAVIDHEMSGTDGLTLAQTVKGDPQFAELRLILVTNLLHRLNPTAMKATGISACLVKPVRQERLLDCMTEVLGPSGAVSVEPEPASAEEHSFALVRPEDVRVLLAEDNQVNQTVALRHLKKLGFTADAVANGLQVLTALQRAPYDIILMDCQMPEMDGYEVTQRIRGGGRDSYIHLKSAPYIVALTANALSGDRERCMEAGMNDYLTKPLQRGDLEAVLQRALLKIRPVAKSMDEEPASGVLDRAVLNDLKELREPGQPDPLAELIELFLRDARPRLEQMRAAAAAGDWAKVGASAHALKGSASNLGARRLSALCANLEKQGKSNDGTQAPASLAEVESEFEKVELTLKQELTK